MPGSVGEQVVQHLDDAPSVGHRAGQVRRQIDQHAVSGAAAQEGVPCPLHKGRDRHGLGGYRERARVHACDIQQVADQPAHVIGLLIDDAEEPAHLHRVKLGFGAQRGGGRTLDRGQWRTQFVAHNAQELGSQPLRLLERRPVLHGDDQRLDRAVRRMGRRRVDHHGDAPSVGDRDLDLLRADRLCIAECVAERDIAESGLALVAAPVGDDLQELLRGSIRIPQHLDEPPRLAVERHRTAGPDIEHHHRDGRGVDQGLQISPGPLPVAVGACVGERHRRLRGKQHQHLLVLLGERLPVPLLAEEEVPDMYASMAHRRRQEGLRQRELVGVAERADVVGQIRRSQRPRQIPRMLVVRQAGGDELLDPPGIVDGGDHCVARASQRTGAVDDLAQDGVEVKARGGAQDRRVELRIALAQRRDLPPRLVGTGQRSIPLRPGALRRYAAPPPPVPRASRATCGPAHASTEPGAERASACRRSAMHAPSTSVPTTPKPRVAAANTQGGQAGPGRRMMVLIARLLGYNAMECPSSGGAGASMSWTPSRVHIVRRYSTSCAMLCTPPVNGQVRWCQHPAVN